MRRSSAAGPPAARRTPGRAPSCRSPRPRTGPLLSLSASVSFCDAAGDDGVHHGADMLAVLGANFVGHFPLLVLAERAHIVHRRGLDEAVARDDRPAVRRALRPVYADGLLLLPERRVIQRPPAEPEEQHHCERWRRDHVRITELPGRFRVEVDRMLISGLERVVTDLLPAHLIDAGRPMGTPHEVMIQRHSLSPLQT